MKDIWIWFLQGFHEKMSRFHMPDEILDDRTNLAQIPNFAKIVNFYVRNVV